MTSCCTVFPIPKRMELHLGHVFIARTRPKRMTLLLLSCIAFTQPKVPKGGVHQHHLWLAIHCLSLQIKRAIRGQQETLRVQERFIAGSLAGATAQTIIYPMEVSFLW